MEAYSKDDYGLASSVFSEDAKHAAPFELETGKRLEVFVIFTETAGTLAALRAAEGLARQLAAHLRLLMPYEVPYALPLTKPAVPVEFLERQMRCLADETAMEVTAQLYLCRDKKRALDVLLGPHSLVVVGGRQRWWPTAAQRLARSLQKCGHHVIFTDLR